MIVLDASALIGHLTASDAHHDQATAILLQAAPNTLLVHSMTLAEVLVGGVRIGKAEQMRRDLMASGIMVTAPVADEPMRLAKLRVTTGLRLPDCCVLLAAEEHQAELATFDVALAAAARQRGVDVRPAMTTKEMTAEE